MGRGQVIRLHVGKGRFIAFDNFVDLFDYVIEGMTLRGDL